MCRNALLIGAVGQTTDSTGETPSDRVEVDADPPETLSPDAAFDLLANGRRRRVVELLCASDGPIALSEVAERLAAAETETADAADGRYKSVYVSLQQTHLPKLEDAGVLEYDEDGREIVARPLLGEIRSYVEEDDPAPQTTRRNDLAAGVCALGAALFGAKTVGVPGLGALPSDPIATLVLLVALVAIVAADYIGDVSE